MRGFCGTDVVHFFCNIQCVSRKVTPKTFCNNSTKAKYIYVKFCQFVANWGIYIHIYVPILVDLS